jgi:hypothetical protein
MKTLLYGGLLLTFLLSLLASGCSDAEKRPHDPPPHVTHAEVPDDTAFHLPELPPGRRLDTIMTADLDGDRRNEYIVTSMGPDIGGRADLVQIFTYDAASRRWSQPIADTAQWVTALTLRDVTGDGLPELVVDTHSGGNDIVASKGLMIFSGEGGSIRAVYSSSYGDPTLTPMEHAKGEAVLLHDELWPEFASHVDAVEYLSDVLAFSGEGYASIRHEQGHRFADEAAKYLREYREERGKFKGDTVVAASAGARPESSFAMHPLFSPAALAMLSFGTGGDLRSLRAFWGSERDYLMRRLPSNQFDELDAIYRRMTAM